MKVTNQAGGATAFENTKVLQGLQASINETIMLDVPDGGDFELELIVRDQSGNSSNKSVNFQVASTNMGTVDLNFRVQYGGETLVMFEEVLYPEPQIPISLSLVSAFISNVTLIDANGETRVLEIERFKINEKQSDMATAEAGTTLSHSRYTPWQLYWLKIWHRCSRRYERQIACGLSTKSSLVFFRGILG